MSWTETWARLKLFVRAHTRLGRRAMRGFYECHDCKDLTPRSEWSTWPAGRCEVCREAYVARDLEEQRQEREGGREAHGRGRGHRGAQIQANTITAGCIVPDAVTERPHPQLGWLAPGSKTGT